MLDLASPLDGFGSPFGARRGLLSLTPDYWVDAIDGSDANDGTTSATPVKTLTQARTLAATGKTIAMRKDQLFPRASPAAVDENLMAYGTGTYGPRVDARQNLSGKTWTDQGSGVFKTSITLSDVTVAGGVGSSTTNFGVWFGELFGTWQVGGADIAANLTALAATSGVLAFAVNKTGSTTQDIRSDTASTGPFDLYVKMPDGLTPQGRDVLCSDKSTVGTFDSRTLIGVELIGSFGKDSSGVSSFATIVNLADCVARDFGEHGWVGPANLTRHTAIGKSRPGAAGATRGQSAGAGVNFYTNTYNSTRTLTVNGLSVQNTAKGLYCHGSGNQGYKSLVISGAPVVFQNVRTGFDCDTAGAGLLPMFVDGIFCTARVEMSGGIDAGWECDGNWRFTGGGSVVLTSTPYANTTVLVNMYGDQSYMELKDYTFECLKANDVSFKNQLCNRATSNSFATPTLILDNCQDISVVANRLLWVRGASPATSEQTHLILKGGTQLWDLADAASRINFPASLTVEAGCQFGWGDRTGPQIEAALTTAGVPFSISGQTTIVGLSGTVKSSPGWK